MPRPSVLFFDVNETLLDLSALAPAFERIFGTSDPMAEWFARMLHGSVVSDLVGHHRPFGLIGAEALMTLAQRRGVDLSPGDAAVTVEKMRDLPAHTEVPTALARLQEAGLRLIALTNSSSDLMAAQLENAGISQRFERAISVEDIGRFKPAPEVYLHAAMRAGVDVDHAMMVAAHDWDIVGARSVGMPGAYVARPSAVWGMPDTPPEIVAADLDGISLQLLAME